MSAALPRGPGEDGAGPWLDTLTTRLRAHYAVDVATPAPASSEPVEQELLARLARLTGDVPGGARYVAAGELDRGGMGRIVLAHDAVLMREVALKQVAAAADRTAPAPSARQQLRLLAEARLLARLQHPGIAPVHDLAVDAAGSPFFVMPRIAGRTLAEVLAKRTAGAREWSLPRIVEVVRRVCETMAYAHARGIAHRDLKPSNVMIGSFGEVYVVDWGLAQTQEAAADAAAGSGPATAQAAGVDLTATGTVLGTPAYMPPERAAARPADGAEAAARGDVYALGAVLYEVLTGAPPYAGERADWTIGQVLEAIRERPPRPLQTFAPGVDAELAAVCERAMHRDPARRYGGMQELAEDLRAWSEHRVVGAAGGGWLVRAAKWQRRNRGLAVTLAVAAGLLLATTAAFVVQLVHARDVAEANARTAEGNLEEILDLAVVQRIEDLQRRAEHDLWPARLASIPAMERWLAEAEGLGAIRARLTARRDTVTWSAAPDPIDPEAAARAAWRRRALDDAIAAAAAFCGPAPGDVRLPLDPSIAAVRLRIPMARSLHERTVGGEPAAAAWRAAAADVKASGRYGAFELRPQEGLLPLGIDPTSGLAEFVHVLTGEPPPRGEDGALRLQADSGLVLVLVPGGEFWMGASPDGERNRDAFAETINEQPVHAVRLSPFLVAKFEMTQAQWLRATGASPSVHGAVSEYVRDEQAPLHPVESISWNEARAVLRKLGLALPTEAQWEYAARAGTTTPWYRGARIEDLLQPPAGNLADASSSKALGVQGWVPTPGLDDGYVMHAPVGTFAANAFGLHDVLGNVWEWCDDEYASYATAPAPGNGARPRAEHPATVMYRGGAFDQPAQEARSGNRAGGPPDRRHFSIGLRPARALD